MMHKQIHKDQFLSFSQKILYKLNIQDSHIASLQEGLLFASMRGIDTHGIRLFPFYVRQIQNNKVNIFPRFDTHFKFPSLGIMNADHALGILAGKEAIRNLIPKVKEQGIAAIAVNNSNHYGPASYYAHLLAKEDLIGFSVTNADALVTPFGAQKRVFGTNPISFVTHIENEKTFNLDMATSQISWSKLQESIANNIALPDNSIVYEKITSEPKNPSDNGACLLPLGGYKGQGLGMMVQILTSALSGAPSDHNLNHALGADRGNTENEGVSHFFYGIRTDLVSKESFSARMKEMIKQTVNSGENILYPGLKEEREMEKRSNNGIPINPSLLETFLNLASEFNVELNI